MGLLRIGFPLLLLFLSACASPVSNPQDTEVSPTAASTDTPIEILPEEIPQEVFEAPPADSSPPSTALPPSCATQITTNDQLFVNYSDANIGTGYCLRYPGSFYISYTRKVGRGIHGPSLRPRENISGGVVVQPLGPSQGKTLNQLADARHLQATNREEIVIGGVPSLLLSSFPEDSTQRVALIIHDDLVFEFNNTEITSDGEDALAQAEEAWRNVLASFAFLPSGFAETYTDCPEPQVKADGLWYMPYVNVEEGYCLLFPQEYVVHYIVGNRHLLIQKPDPGFNHDPGAVTLSILGDQPSGGLELHILVNQVVEAQARGEVYRINTPIAGQDGVFVDGLYSEAGVRHIFFLYNDIFYRVIVRPTLVEERSADVEDLFGIVTGSLTFIP
ncbi:MAG: hypothetical protein DWQ07_08590 [Chloroflexi bacterium]|nr:MAG: hypothetical protein DWQ07_08590 [Chloroflexota bacterium]MBL1193231.1 hypothetical protein [Chloroflexota bacterium]NOH10526.1 hypothetical protein [Chloroflexota bacterium]